MQFKTFISSLTIIFFVVLLSLVYMHEENKNTASDAYINSVTKQILVKDNKTNSIDPENPLKQANGAVETEEKRLTTLVRKVLKDNPELLEEALSEVKNRAQQKLDAELKQRLTNARHQLESQAADPRLGAGGDTLKVVQFIDTNCGFCHKMNPVIQRVLEENSDVEIIIKYLPILGVGSLDAARISLIIYKKYPAKFKEYHNFMMQQYGTKQDKKFILNNLNKFSINPSEISMYLDNNDFMREIDAALASNIALSETLNARGTPFYVIGNAIIPGAVDFTNFQKILEAQRRAKE